MADTKATEGGLEKIAGYGGAVAGFLLARYCGASLMLPVAIAIGVFWFARKKLSGDRRRVLGPASIAIGHTGWMIFAAMYLGNWSPVSTDVVVFSALVAWLVVRPAMAPLIALAAFQAIALFVNVIAISKLEVGTSSHSALTAHIVLRVVCLISIYVAATILKVERAIPIAEPEAHS
jgi:hypothetical protein